MDRFFNANNPLMRFLSRMVDLVVLNILTILCCVPLVTAGASLTAMNYVALHQVRGDETYIRKMFIKSFRQNLKQGAVIGMIFIALAAVVAADLLILRKFDTRATTGAMLLITFVAVFIFILGIWAFALLARFENTIAGTIGNAARLFLGHLPRSLAMAAVWIAWGFLLWNLRSGLVLVVMLYGVSLPGFVCATLYDPVFRKMESEEQEQIIVS